MSKVTKNYRHNKKIGYISWKTYPILIRNAQESLLSVVLVRYS